MRKRTVSLIVASFVTGVFVFTSTAHAAPVAQASSLKCETGGNHWWEEVTATSEQRLNVPAGALNVTAAKNGGIQVRGWDGDHYEVLACNVAAGENEAAAQQRLAQIKVVVNGGRLSVEGPENERWSTFLLIHAPRNSNLDLHAINGPVDVRDVSGTLALEAQNGPLALRNCSGQIKATAENGPIDLIGENGSATLKATNGPVAVRVHGHQWTGGQVEARSENGPVVLAVPEGFQSSFLVEASEHAPMNCAATFCDQVRKTWDNNERRMEYGSGSPVLKLSTENGPIEVKTARADF